MSRILSKLTPTLMTDSLWDLTPKKLSEMGICGLIADIDGTLVPQDEPADEQALAYLAALKEAGIQCFIISNNSCERVASFAEAAGCDYVCKAGKPSPAGYRRALEKMGLTAAQSLAVGDQLFTDIWGANRAGIRSVLVKPLGPQKEDFTVRLKRVFEKPLLYLIRK